MLIISTLIVYGERNMSQRMRKGQACQVELEHFKIVSTARAEGLD